MKEPENELKHNNCQDCQAHLAYLGLQQQMRALEQQKQDLRAQIEAISRKLGALIQMREKKRVQTNMLGEVHGDTWNGADGICANVNGGCFDRWI